MGCRPETEPVAREVADGGRDRAAVVRLRRRREFLAARHGRKAVTPGFVLQAVPRRADDDGGLIGLGFTVSRKVGKAVARNRARRRLREVARAVFPGPAQPGTNYVIVARASVLTCPFDRLLHDLRGALERVSRAGGRSRSGSPVARSTSTGT